MAEILAVCKSEKKGTRKENVGRGVLNENYGLLGDAHAGSDREVSLLASEEIEKFKKKFNIDINYGAFGENLTTNGIDFEKIKIGTKIKIGESLLEITQKGKECHIGCAIYKQVGKCIMPKLGVFANVIESGYVKSGDKIEIISSQKLCTQLSK